MKKTCKILALLLAVLLMAGCGNRDVSGKIEPAETTENKTSTIETTQQTDAKETTAATPEATHPTEATTQPTTVQESTNNGKTVSLGRIEGGTYTNSYVGVGCKLDSNWQFYNAQELQELPANVQEVLADSELGETMDSYTQIYDMMAENVNELMSMNVLYTQLSISDRLLYAAMSEEDVIDSILSTQKQMLIDSYTSAGYNVSKLEKKAVTFLGQPRTALYMEATVEGDAVYTLQIMDYTLGKYGVTVTFTSYLENKTEDMLALFYEA